LLAFMLWRKVEQSAIMIDVAQFVGSSNSIVYLVVVACKVCSMYMLKLHM
jgi:hypothetical protein